MITYISENLFTSPAQVLVNAVNTEGVMGKGIALQFKIAFPEMFAEYQKLCEKGEIDIGKLWIYKGSPNKWILNFPTKRSWRQPSQLGFIEKGLKKFVEEFDQLNINSIAFPALGCGNGDLDWTDVKPLMEQYLERLPADIFIYPPMSRDELPEHKDQKAIIEWLRSEPRTLPFAEVWNDIEKLLSEKQTFRTSETTFTAKIENAFLVATTNSRDHKIAYDDLQFLWSRFRTHGYLRRGIITVPYEKYFSYIIPILSELDYVKRVEITDKKVTRPYIALQYMPPIEITPSQLALF